MIIKSKLTKNTFLSILLLLTDFIGIYERRVLYPVKKIIDMAVYPLIMSVIVMLLTLTKIHFQVASRMPQELTVSALKLFLSEKVTRL